MPAPVAIPPASSSPPGVAMFDPLQAQDSAVRTAGHDPLQVKCFPVGSVRFLELEKPQQGLPLLDGITVTEQRVPILNAQGKPTLDESGAPAISTTLVYEAHFAGHRRTFRIGDHLPGTDFEITDIFMNRPDPDGQPRSGLDLRPVAPDKK